MVQRKLNVKLLAWLVGGCLVAVVGFHLVHLYQVDRNARYSLEIAKQAKQRGELREAAEHYGRYLNLRPDDYAVFADMADVMVKNCDLETAKIRDRQEAFSILDKAIRTIPQQDPDDPQVAEIHERVRRLAVDFHMKWGPLQNAEEHLQFLIAKHLDDADLELQYARCLIGKREHDAAIEQYAKIVGLDLQTKQFDLKKASGPTKIDAYVELASLLKAPQRKDLDLVDRLMDYMIEVNPESFRAYLERGRYRQQNNEMELAKKDIDKAGELEPNDAQVILSAAELAMADKDFATAQKFVEKGLKEHPKEEGMYLTGAELASQQKKLDEALQQVEQGLSVLPNSPRLLITKADYQLRKRDVDAVRKTIDQMERAEVAEAYVVFLEARLHQVDNRWVDAAREFERVRPMLIHLPRQTILQIDDLLGQCYEMMGQADRALEAYARALQANPADPMARAGTDRLQQRFATQKPVPNSDVPKSDVPKEDPQRSLKQMVEEYVQGRKLDEVDTLIIGARLLMKQKKFDEANHEIEMAMEKYPANRKLLLESISVALQHPGKGIDDALRLFGQAKQKLSPDEMQSLTEEGLWSSAISLALQNPDKGPTVARRLLERAEKQLGGDSLTLRIIKAKLLAAEGGDNLREQLAQLEEGLDDRDTGNQLQFWFGMAQTYYQLRLREDARRCFQKVDALRPHDLQIRTVLFELAMDAGDDKAMREAIEAIRELGEDTVWRYCSAVRIVYRVQKNLDGRVALADAQKMIDEAKEARPEWAELYRLQGEIDLLNNNQQAAIDDFSRSVKLGGRPNPNAVAKLVGLLWMAQRHQEAMTVLQLLPEEQQSILRPNILVELYLRTGATEKAIALARQAAEADPQDPARQLLVGQACLQAKQPEAAEAAMRRAVELAPGVARSWITLIATLHNNGKKVEAEEELRKAQLNLSEDQVSLVMAQCSEIVGDMEAAERHYQMAHQTNPQDLTVLRSLATFYLKDSYQRPDKRAKMTEYLNAMVRVADANSDANDDNARWARRIAARVLASSQGFRDLLEAIKLIERNAIQGRLQPEDNLEKAKILATCPDPAAHREAIEIFGQLNDQGMLSVNDRVLLAQLYLRADNWPKCRDLMEELKTENASDARIWALYSRMLLDRDDASPAAQHVNKLESLDPKGPVTLEMKARLLVKQGKPRDAVATLKRALPEKLSAQDLILAGSIARVLMDIKQYAAAEEILRKRVELDGRAALELAHFLGRYGSVDEAFGIFEQSAGTQSITDVLNVAVDTLRYRRADIGQRYDAQMEKWFDKALRGNPGARATLLQLALFRDLQERYDDVESIYRQLLARSDLADPQRAAVLNNLAFFYALSDKNGQEGLEFVNEAIRLIGPTGDLLDTRGLLKIALGDHQGAVEDMNQSIQAGPTALKLFHLALAELAAGNKESAHDAYVKARRLGLSDNGIGTLERKRHQRLIYELGLRAKA